MAHRSTRLNILIALPAGEVIFNALKTSLPGLHLSFQPTNQAGEIPLDVWRSCQVLYTERALPDPAWTPNLEWIQFHYAGIDYALQAPILARPGLQITTLSGVPAMPMGEYTLMMLLALGHHLDTMCANQASQTWPENRFDALSPLELRHSTVGIVGYGSTGRQAARLLKAFGARVLATKRDAAVRADAGYAPRGVGDPHGRCVDRLFPAEQLLKMLPACDFVVVCVPLSGATRSLIGRAELTAMKPGAYLINIARGGVVDHAALLEALHSGHLGGAALDVFPTEPLPPGDPLWTCPNVWISPHISGYSPAYFEDAARLFVKNLRRFRAGQPLLNRFYPETGY